MPRKALALFILVGLAWGIPYFFIRVALNDFAPSTIAFVRVTVGALVLLPIAAKQGTLRSALKQWPWILAFALIEMAGPWIMLPTSEQHVSSGLAGLLVATVPFVATPLTYFMGDKSVFHPKAIAGLVIGFAGIIALVGIDALSGHIDPFWVGVLLLVAVCYAVAPVIADRKLNAESSVAVIGLAMAMVAVIYAVPVSTQLPAEIAAGPHWQSWVALAVLGLVCSALAFVVFFSLIGLIGVARSSLIVYVNMAVALALGIVFLKEPITTGFVIGVPMVIVGLLLAGRKRS